MPDLTAALERLKKLDEAAKHCSIDLPDVDLVALLAMLPALRACAEELWVSAPAICVGVCFGDEHDKQCVANRAALDALAKAVPNA